MAFERRLRLAGLVFSAILVPLAIYSRRYNGGCKSDHGLSSLNVGDRIFVFANVIRPSLDPCERYAYVDFPFCPQGDHVMNRTRSFSDIVSGDCYTNTQYSLRFKTDNGIRKTLCEKNLTESEVAKFRDAIERNFVYELAYENRVLLGEVGRIEEDEEDQNPKYYLSTHTVFYIRYYGDQVIDMTIMRDHDSEIDITTADKLNVCFTYSVLWEKMTQPVKFPERVSENVRFWKHWSSRFFIWLFAISTVTLPYLLGYLNVYRKKKTYSDVERNFTPRYIHSHGEHCNCPQYTALLGAILGNGTRLFIMICVLFYMVYRGSLRPCDLKSLSSIIAPMYCLLSVISGYIAVFFHTKFTHVGWKQCIFQSETILAVPVLVTAVYANQMAILSSKSNEAYILELKVIIVDALIWVVPSATLASLGGSLAMRLGRKRYLRPPRCIAAVAMRRSPAMVRKWYVGTSVQVIAGGVEPFVMVFPLMDEIFASLWRFKLCCAFTTLLISFFLVVGVTVMLAIGLTELAGDDHRWPWRSVIRGGFPAILAFGYGIYFLSKLRVDQPTQLRILAYNACACYALFFILATISFFASSYTHFCTNVLHIFQKDE